MTFSAGDAHDVVIYAGRFRTPPFPIYDSSGNLVTGAAALDTERSLDYGTYVDCTNEAIEIATSSGMYYLDLTATETTGSDLSTITKTSTSGARTTPQSFSIIRFPIFESGTAQAGAASTITLASSASAKDNFYAGLYIQCSNNTPANVQGQTRMIISYVGSTKVATVESPWGTNPSVATTYDILMPLTANLAAVLCQRMPDWSTAGVPKVDTGFLAGTAQTARDIGASVLLSSGTGAGQLDFTSGVVKSSLVQILGSVISGTAAQIAAAFTKFFDKATPTGTINSIPDVVAGAAGGLFIAGTNAATTITTGLTTTFTGNLTGSVASVSGAVGSVTGSVGGNVTGSVGSVTGAVGSVTGSVGGNVTGTVGTVNAIAANAITAAATAADFKTAIVAAINASVIEGSLTFLQAQRIFLAVSAGLVVGAGTTTLTIKDTTGAKSRIIATVDTDGNRSSVTLDVT